MMSLLFSVNVYKQKNCFELSLEEIEAHNYGPPLRGIWRYCLNLCLQEAKIRQKDVAKCCGFGSSSLSLWLNGKFTGDSSNLLRKLKNWIQRDFPHIYAY